MTELSKKYVYSREWIQGKIHDFSPEIKTRKPRAVTVVIDATYFGKRRDKLGLIVAKDVLLKAPIAYNFIVTETKVVYITRKYYHKFYPKVTSLIGSKLYFMLLRKQSKKKIE